MSQDAPMVPAGLAGKIAVRAPRAKLRPASEKTEILPRNI